MHSSRPLALAWLVLWSLLVAACSVEGMIDRLTTPEDRAFAQSFVENVRTGNEEALKPEFDSELWAKSREQLPQARPLFPPGQSETRLIGFDVSTNLSGGASTTRKEFTLVTTDQTHWTVTRFVTLAENGPARVVEWNVNGSKEPPPEVQVLEAWKRTLPWVQGIAVALLVAGGLLIFWLVRRSRRRAAARP